jgi:hypothetical protein
MSFAQVSSGVRLTVPKLFGAKGGPMRPSSQSYRALATPVALVFLAALAACSSLESEFQPLDVKPGQFTSAERCGTCHKDIYSVWRNSVHARSVTNPVFQALYLEALEITGGEAKELCLTCHAPTVLVTGDFDLKDPITREGVTCDFCHSLKDTHLDQSRNPFELQLSNIKLGPARDADSSGHLVAFSEFHSSSLVCAGCHQFSNEQGVEILSTFSEWELYRQMGGSKSCQDCHMPLVSAHIVDPKVKRVAGAFVNLHQMPGGHSRHQLTKSLRMRIVELDRDPRGLAVRIKVDNTGGGHHVPTGSPARVIVLGVEALAEGQRYYDERVYQKIIHDQEGQVLHRDSLLFTKAHSIGGDTRIAPFEERVEEFILPVPSDISVQVTATLTYLYSPHQTKETETRILFWTERRELLTRWERK